MLSCETSIGETDATMDNISIEPEETFQCLQSLLQEAPIFSDSQDLMPKNYTPTVK